MGFEQQWRCSPGPVGSESAHMDAWRREQLLLAGFDERLAGQLAVTPGIDLHNLLSLVDCGCPPALAVRILEPVTDASHRSVRG
jgi:hypothetical protein